MIKKKLTLISILILISLVLISAFIIEFALGHEPCNLCVYQRIPYFLSIFLIGLIFFVKKLEKITLLSLSIVFFISFVLAFYHFGIEQGFFKETTACFTDNLQNELTKEQILEKYLDLIASISLWNAGTLDWWATHFSSKNRINSPVLPYLQELHQQI